MKAIWAFAAGQWKRLEGTITGRIIGRCTALFCALAVVTAAFAGADRAVPPGVKDWLGVFYYPLWIGLPTIIVVTQIAWESLDRLRESQNAQWLESLSEQANVTLEDFPLTPWSQKMRKPLPETTGRRREY